MLAFQLHWWYMYTPKAGAIFQGELSKDFLSLCVQRSEGEWREGRRGEWRELGRENRGKDFIKFILLATPGLCAWLICYVALTVLVNNVLFACSFKLLATITVLSSVCKFLHSLQWAQGHQHNVMLLIILTIDCLTWEVLKTSQDSLTLQIKQVWRKYTALSYTLLISVYFLALSWMRIPAVWTQYKMCMKCR